MVSDEARRFEQLLGALATNEEVAAFLSRYPARDKAIQAVEDDMAIQRRRLVEDLRAITRPHTAAAIAARYARDELILGSRI